MSRKLVPMMVVFNRSRNEFTSTVGDPTPCKCNNPGRDKDCYRVQHARELFGDSSIQCVNTYHLVRRPDVGSFSGVCSLFVKINADVLEWHKKLGIGDFIENKGEDED